MYFKQVTKSLDKNKSKNVKYNSISKIEKFYITKDYGDYETNITIIPMGKYSRKLNVEFMFQKICGKNNTAFPNKEELNKKIREFRDITTGDVKCIYDGSRFSRVLSVCKKSVIIPLSNSLAKDPSLLIPRLYAMEKNFYGKSMSKIVDTCKK